MDRPDPDTPVTLAEVARLADVSTATASRALNGSAPVSPGVARRVEQAVRELGYVRRRAPSAGGRDTGAIAVVIHDALLLSRADAFHTRLLVSAERALLTAGRELVLLTASGRASRPSLVRYLCGGHVDGVLLVGLRTDDSLPHLIRAAGVPVLLLGRPARAGGLPYVDADNLGGAAAAVAHLLRSGRRSIATIAGPPDLPAGTDRLRGYRRAIREGGAPTRELVAFGDFSTRSGEHAMLRLLDLRPGLDAVFAASDTMAAGALRVLRRLRIRVPEDIALVGFDDGALARRTTPPLSTVHQPVEEMAVRSVAELGGCAQVVLETRLVLRESA